MHKRHLMLAAAILLATHPSAKAYEWSAAPITVHEWGVEAFDWANPTPKSPLLPNFIHTDKNPGMPQPATTQPVKYLPPDNGARFKPVLHFYLPQHSLGEAIVGVELRFANGHANAWYPQASLYRTPAMTANALAPDLDVWKKMPAGGFALGRTPEDPRMELAWSRLTLSNDLPSAVKLEEVPQKHWIHTAREVKSAYISNGSETERFLFYEGAIHETPAIAIIPDLPTQAARSFASHIVNVSSRPIHNVFAIYHRNGHTWIGYVSALDSFQVPAANLPRVAGGGAGFTIPTIPLPDFDTFTDWTDEKTFHALTTDRFISALSENGAMVIDRGFRNPSFPQGPTMAGNLFPEEAAAVEKIWHDDFFNSEGLTVVYRESPAALDEAMPLNLYTDMYHYIQLSRCGLVVNKNVNIKAATTAFSTTVAAIEKLDPEARAQALAQIKANRMFLEGSIAFDERTGQTSEINRLKQLQQLIDTP